MEHHVVVTGTYVLNVSWRRTGCSVLFTRRTIVQSHLGHRLFNQISSIKRVSSNQTQTLCLISREWTDVVLPCGSLRKCCLFFFSHLLLLTLLRALEVHIAVVLFGNLCTAFGNKIFSERVYPNLTQVAGCLYVQAWRAHTLLVQV